MMLASQTIINVHVTDDEGYLIGHVVPVLIDYLVDIIRDYGADADGTRGLMRTEYDILDATIDPKDWAGLSLAQISWVLDEARTIFHQRDKHYT